MFKFAQTPILRFELRYFNRRLTTLEPTFEVFALFTKPNWDLADGGIVYKLETPNFWQANLLRSPKTELIGTLIAPLGPTAYA